MRRQLSGLMLAAARHQPAGPWPGDHAALRALDAVGLEGEGDALVEAAAFHRVVHQLLQHAGEVLRSAPTVHDRLQSQRARGVMRELQTIADLGWLADVLDRVAPGWVVVKGVALSNRVYASPVERPSGDLDVLVAPERFGAAVDALEAAGARLLDRNWTMLRAEVRGQLHFALPHGTLLDLHWHVLNRGMVRREFTVPTGPLLARAVPVQIGPIHTRTLGAEDTVLHLCLHAALSGGHRVGWLMDVDRALRTLSPDQERLVSGARSWRARAAVGCVLWRAERLLGSPVRPEVIDALVGRPTRWAASAVQLVDPIGCRRSDSGVTALWTPTLRDHGAGRMSPRIRRQLRVPRVVPPRARATEPSILSPASDGSSRDDYLDTVLAQARVDPPS